MEGGLGQNIDNPDGWEEVFVEVTENPPRV
jgi:hypothetical protein